MEMSAVTKKNRGIWLRANVELLRIAKRLVRVTETSEDAQKDVMYSLPGIFALELCAGKNRIRLIKEGNALRIMKKTEKSDILTSIVFEDENVLSRVAANRATAATALSEGRVSYCGTSKHFSAIMRIFYVSDKLFLSDAKWSALYGDGAKR